MGLIGSKSALEGLLALTQGDMTLGQLSKVIQRAPTTTARALRILLDEHLVGQRGARKSGRYSLDRTAPLTDTYLHLARHQVPIASSLRIIAAASPAVEFVAKSKTEVLVVFTSVSRSDDQSRAAKEFDRLVSAHQLRIEYLYHDDVRRRQAVDNELRIRAKRLKTIYGNSNRSFPDRGRHALREGVLLRSPNASVHLPSDRLVARLKQQFGLETIGLFGSAVRSNFRKDSDVDVVVRLKSNGHTPRDVIFELKRILEPVFDRDVDIVVANGLRPELLREIEAQEIPL